MSKSIFFFFFYVGRMEAVIKDTACVLTFSAASTTFTSVVVGKVSFVATVSTAFTSVTLFEAAFLPLFFACDLFIISKFNMLKKLITYWITAYWNE